MADVKELEADLRSTKDKHSDSYKKLSLAQKTLGKEKKKGNRTNAHPSVLAANDKVSKLKDEVMEHEIAISRLEEKLEKLTGDSYRPVRFGGKKRRTHKRKATRRRKTHRRRK